MKMFRKLPAFWVCGPSHRSERKPTSKQNTLLIAILFRFISAPRCVFGLCGFLSAADFRSTLKQRPTD